MPTYRTSGRNQFRTPLGAVGDPPDVPGYLATFSDDLDNYLGVGGAEYCAGSVNSIPTSRRFVGKLAYYAPTDTVYRYVGAGGTALGASAPAGAVWQAWEKPPTVYTPTFSNMSPGTGPVQAVWGIAAGIAYAYVSVVSGSGYSITSGADVTISVPTNFIAGFVTGRGIYYRNGSTNNGSEYDLFPHVPGTGTAATGSFRVRVNSQTGTAAGVAVGGYILGNQIVTPWTSDSFMVEARSPSGATA